MHHFNTNKDSAAFLAESTLGKLAKWLRLAGFDTLFDKSRPDPIRLKQIASAEGRVILTRTKTVIRHAQPQECLFIRSNAPLDQAREVMSYFKIQRKSLRPLSRCAICNCPLQRISREELEDRVPAYVRQQHDFFMNCQQCNRVYWSGTHVAKMNAIMDRWF